MPFQQFRIFHTRIIGILFLMAFIFYGSGRHFFASDDTWMKYTGAALIVLNSIVVFSIGILFRKTLNQYNVSVGSIYFSGRIVEALTLASIVINTANASYVNQELGYFAGMLLLGMVSIPMCWLLYKYRLTPKWLAIWGLVGYTIFSFGFLLELLGKQWSMYFMLGAGLWEVVFACWLIIKNCRNKQSYSASIERKPNLIQPYLPNWEKDFKILKEAIENTLHGLEYSIEHVGSTSVPNLAAKPIIDIDIIYNGKDNFEKIKWGLENIGYYHAGNQGIKDRDVFKRNGIYVEEVLDAVPHHLYVCPVESKALERHILSRNFLRKNAWAREKYQLLKYELADKAGQDRKSYAVLKELHVNDFIDLIIEEEKRTQT